MFSWSRISKNILFWESKFIKNEENDFPSESKEKKVPRVIFLVIVLILRTLQHTHLHPTLVTPIPAPHIL